MRRYIFGWLAIVLFCQQRGVERFLILTVEPYQTAYQFDFYFSFVIFNKINYICFIQCFYHFNLISDFASCHMFNSKCQVIQIKFFEIEKKRREDIETTHSPILKDREQNTHINCSFYSQNAKKLLVTCIIPLIKLRILHVITT